MTVSVIIPYNKDRGFLSETIKSVEQQTIKCELILSQSDHSVSRNINEGVKKASGDYIKITAEDDPLTPDSIEQSLNVIRDHDFIHGNALLFWPTGVTQPYFPAIKMPTLADMLRSNFIHGGTVLYRKDCFERFGGFDETLWCAEEYDFNLRLLYHGCSLGYCNAFLQKYRRHRTQKSLGNIDRVYQSKRQDEIAKIRARYGA